MTIPFFILFLCNQQDIVPLLAPISTIALLSYLFVTSTFSRQIFTSYPWLILCALLVYSLIITGVNVLDQAIETPVQFFSGPARIFYVLIVCLLFAVVWRVRNFEQSIINACFLTGCFTASLSLFCWFTQPLYLPTGEVIGVNRAGTAIGLLGDKNPFAGSLGPAILCGLSICMNSKSRYISCVTLAGCALIAFCMGLSDSRGYFFSIIITATCMLVAYALINRKLILPVFATGIIFAGALSLFIWKSWYRIIELADGSAVNIHRRFALFDYYWELIKASPLTGLGPGSAKMANLSWEPLLPGLISYRTGGSAVDKIYWEGNLSIGNHAHNTILEIIQNFGFIGVLLFSAWLAIILLRSRFHLSSCIILSALCMHQLLAGMVSAYTFYSPTIALPFYLLAAVIMLKSLPATSSANTASTGNTSNETT